LKRSTARRPGWAVDRSLRALLVLLLLLTTGCASFSSGDDQPASSADLTVTQSITPNPPVTGAPITYTITITNNGPDTAPNLILLDTLPEGVDYISATPDQGNCELVAHTAVSCVLNDLENNYQATVEIVVSSSTTGVINNTASAGSKAADTDTTDNTIPFEVSVSSPFIYLPFISR
jgi:uncharacterized repeat protein (TIGR01451 family)